jgi:Tfp pilus assembly protein PilX
MRNVKIAQRGSVLIVLIITMLIMGTLGTSMYLLTTTSTFGSLFSNKANRALLLAESGIRYAQQQATATGSLDVTLNSSADRITVSWATDAGTLIKTANSTGIADANSFWSVRRKMTYVSGTPGASDSGPAAETFGGGGQTFLDTTKLATAKIGNHTIDANTEYRGSPPGDTTGRFKITDNAICVSDTGLVERFYFMYEPEKYNF